MNSKCIHYSNDVSADLESFVFQQASVLTSIGRKISEFFIRLKIEQEQMQDPKVPCTMFGVVLSGRCTGGGQLIQKFDSMPQPVVR